jgi:lipoate-protein ligase A
MSSALPLYLVDRSLPRPEENLALDEALLQECDRAVRSDRRVGYLRIWESPRYFVVLGVSRRLKEDVKVEACREAGVAVLRRASGGGTVLQGPGCLNVTLVLPLDHDPRLSGVKESTCFIAKKIVTALAVPGGTVKGTSDMVLLDRKFGGSAQKRTPRALMHHVSLLCDFDLERIARYLEEPRKQPEYRRQRTHEEFLINLSLPPGEVRLRLTRICSGMSIRPIQDLPAIDRLVREKYSRAEWTERF